MFVANGPQGRPAPALPPQLAQLGIQPPQLPPGWSGVMVVQICGDAPITIPLGDQATVPLPGAGMPMGQGQLGLPGGQAMPGMPVGQPGAGMLNGQPQLPGMPDLGQLFGGVDLMGLLRALIGQGRVARRPADFAGQPIQPIARPGGFDPAQGAAPVAPMDAHARNVRLLELVNAERAKVGAPPLTLDEGLSGVAQKHSEDMAKRGYFSHNTPEGKSPWQRAGEAGLAAHAENIAGGGATPEDAMRLWMNSPGHKANILNPALSTMGAGMQDGKWTQMFA